MIGCMIIHGYTGSLYEINPLITFLQENTNWHIESPTLPGHGRILALRDVSYKSWLKACENVLHDMMEKFETIYVIGFSMGGMIAAYLAATCRVDRLVLLATAGKFISTKQMLRDAGVLALAGLKGNLQKNKLYRQYRNKIRTVPLKANIEFFKLVRFTRPFLGKVVTPVLIAQGRQDNMVPFKTAYYLEEEIASNVKKVVFFEQSRHQLCLGTDRDILNQMIYTFLCDGV